MFDERTQGRAALTPKLGTDNTGKGQEKDSMAAERLSKLQKFILSAAYKKTVMKEELPVKISWFYRGMQCKDEFAPLFNELYFKALYESDILMNFYDKWTPQEKYGYIGGSNKEKTALSRSLKTLYERGYINDYRQRYIESDGLFDTRYGSKPLHYNSNSIITLTSKGRKTALKFLNVVEVSAGGLVQQ